MKKSLGIKKTFLITVSLTLSILLLLTSYVGYRSAKEIVYEKGSKEAREAIEKYGNQLDGWLEARGTMVKTMAQVMEQEEMDETDRAYVEPMLSRVAGMTEGLVDNYIGFSNKEMYCLLPVPEGYDPTGRDWYQAAVEKGGLIYTEPYVDVSSNQMVITIAHPCYKANGDVLGVYALDISIEYLINLASEISLSENGYPVLVDNQGNILVHKEEAYTPYVEGEDEFKTKIDEIPGDYTELLAKAESGQAGFELGWDSDGAQKYFVSKRLNTNDWVLAYLLPEKDFTKTLDKLLRVYGYIAVAALLAGNLIVLLVLRKVLKPISAMNKIAEEMAKGNLNPDISYYSRDEIGALYEGLQKSNQAIRGYIEDINYVLGEMGRGNFTAKIEKEYLGDFIPIKNALNGISDILNNVLFEIKASTNEISQGADTVAEEATNLAAGVAEQSTAITQLEGNMRKVVAHVESNKEDAGNARILAGEAKDEIEVSNGKMEELLEAMQEISEMSSEVSKIVKTIDDISFQTNILSLNAAVEAARSGEAGKGFAVVASEVRTLAGKSAEAASQTADLIQRTVEAVKKGEEIAQETAAALSATVEKTLKVDRYIEEIDQATEEEAGYIEEISGQINIITNVVERNNDGAQKSAASSEELSGQSAVMQDMISRFRLRRDMQYR